MTLLPLIVLLKVLGGFLADTDGPESSSVSAAAILYTGYPVDEAEVSHCMALPEDQIPTCEVDRMTREAAEAGASLIVLSEYAFDSDYPESEPVVGRRPRSRRSPVLSHFGRLADELNVYLVLPLATENGYQIHSSQVALGPDGTVVAVHHKVELYDSEQDDFTAGESVTTFETPFGVVGMLICSDLYAEPSFHEEMVRERGATIIALSSLWTVPDASRWYASFARDWRVHVVAANAAVGKGRGGGIYDPTGRGLTTTDSGYDEVLVSEVVP